MPKGTLNVCLVGQKFMGRAHSNAFLKADKFFDLSPKPLMHTVVGRNEAELNAFAARWGWQHTSTDWKSAVADPAIDLVDISTPNNLHRDIAIAALEAGKHVACEKPLASTLPDARAMLDAAKKAKKSKTFVWYNYRRVPALALAHQLVKEGRIGRIYHIRAFYLQDWAGPNVPLLWRFDKSQSGSGALGDLAAHIVDMARFVTGQEITEILGAAQDTFIKERSLSATGTGGGIADGAKGGSKKLKVTVDDHSTFLARMTGGTVATFESTRFATGNQNKNGLEINGEKGSLRFNFEDMNYLGYFNAEEERKIQGWRNIMVTHAPDHPYAANWWPDAHIVGYEHTFINMAADIANALAGHPPITPLPDFADAYKTQQVLAAVETSAQNRAAVKVSEMK